MEVWSKNPKRNHIIDAEALTYKAQTSKPALKNDPPRMDPKSHQSRTALYQALCSSQLAGEAEQASVDWIEKITLRIWSCSEYHKPKLSSKCKKKKTENIKYHLLPMVRTFRGLTLSWMPGYPLLSFSWCIWTRIHHPCKYRENLVTNVHFPRANSNLITRFALMSSRMKS